MDEYEKLEYELERVYETYISRFRNLDFLEHELDTLNKEEEEKMEENERALKRMQKRLREEEWRMLRGEGDDEKRDHTHRVQGNMQPEEDVSDSADVSSESDPISLASSQSGASRPSAHSSEDILDESEESHVLHDSEEEPPKSRGDHDF